VTAELEGATPQITKSWNCNHYHDELGCSASTGSYVIIKISSQKLLKWNIDTTRRFKMLRSSSRGRLGFVTV